MKKVLIAGATGIGIGTALFYDPLICPTINKGIEDYLVKHQIGQVADLIGTLTLN